MSDHADWNGLNESISATGAEKVFITHGYTFQFARWLNEKGYNAQEVKTEYRGEVIEETVELTENATEQQGNE